MTHEEIMHSSINGGLLVAGVGTAFGRPFMSFLGVWFILCFLATLLLLWRLGGGPR